MAILLACLALVACDTTRTLVVASGSQGSERNAGVTVWFTDDQGGKRVTVAVPRISDQGQDCAWMSTALEDSVDVLGPNGCRMRLRRHGHVAPWVVALLIDGDVGASDAQSLLGEPGIHRVFAGLPCGLDDGVLAEVDMDILCQGQALRRTIVCSVSGNIVQLGGVFFGRDTVVSIVVRAGGSVFHGQVSAVRIASAAHKLSRRQRADLDVVVLLRQDGH